MSTTTPAVSSSPLTATVAELIGELRDAKLHAEFVRQEALKMLGIRLEEAIVHELRGLSARVRDGTGLLAPGMKLSFVLSGEAPLTGMNAEVSDEELSSQHFGTVHAMAAQITGSKELRSKAEQQVLQPLRVELREAGLTDAHVSCDDRAFSLTFTVPEF